ncbi:MAG: gamma-glutamyl-gamma-aminobutyrate hydrolase family protein, partial [Nitrosospira sp.]
MHQKILILDFGSQYTQLIARRVRETHVYCEVHPCDVSSAFIKEFEPVGIILSGGPASAAEEETSRAPNIIFELGVPVLGICYGMQTMAAQLGGAVANSKVREFGYAEVETATETPLLRDIHDRTNTDGRQVLDVWA